MQELKTCEACGTESVIVHREVDRSETNLVADNAYWPDSVIHLPLREIFDGEMTNSIAQRGRVLECGICGKTTAEALECVV